VKINTKDGAKGKGKMTQGER